MGRGEKAARTAHSGMGLESVPHSHTDTWAIVLFHPRQSWAAVNQGAQRGPRDSFILQAAPLCVRSSAVPGVHGVNKHAQLLPGKWEAAFTRSCRNVLGVSGCGECNQSLVQVLQDKSTGIIDVDGLETGGSCDLEQARKMPKEREYQGGTVT